MTTEKTIAQTLSQTLGSFAAGPVQPHQRMKDFVCCSLFDWASVGLAGVREPVSEVARKTALDMSSGAGEATLIGGEMATPAMAALANGAISHALDYDDTHFGHIGHPSVAVIPAALALSEAEGVSGQSFVEALAVGLETACRIGAWLGRPHYEAGFHQTGTSGAFGATVAAGRVLGLNAAEMAEALSLTATRAAGLKSQFGTMGKPLNAGFAAEVGVVSAMLARAGGSSTSLAIEGPQGFGPTHKGMADASALDGLGESWLFPAISYKFHACCHGLHAMLEATRSLMEQGLDASSIEAVAIHTHPRWMSVCNQPEPQTGLEAKFSFRLTAAMMLSGMDTGALDVYSVETCQRPDLVALRDRVEVIADDSLVDTVARITVKTGGGSVTATHDILSEMTAEDARDRLRQKSAMLLGAASSDALFEAVMTLDGQASVSELSALLGGA
ncbi:MmgE/PrpD family protein [uncultured Cohaesibacter sp.]|uniref:MmgE/PrpD family protein n=1 Tax=uncultured Cohaesibacter sp. TaxID=1002546 RepID=UPI0029C939A0|nr:MmgE/PrpD family protein [uncultured Cohaesibacter sp.]